MFVGFHFILYLFKISFFTLYVIFEPQHDKTNKMTSVPSEDSDQSGHPSAQSDQSSQSLGS